MNIFNISKALKSLSPNANWYIIGDKYENLVWLENTPKPSYQELLEEWEKIKNDVIWDPIRLERDQLLRETDWATLPDATPKPSKEAWLNYRQALRNITKTYSSPEAVIWPTKPS